MATNFDVAAAIVKLFRQTDPVLPADTAVGTTIKTATGSAHTSDEFVIDLRASRASLNGISHPLDIGTRAIARG